MFELIPGHLPKLTKVREIGRASGELSTALSKVEIWDRGHLPTPPYFELYKVHKAINRDLLFEKLKSEAFNDVREWTEFLTSWILKMEK